MEHHRILDAEQARRRIEAAAAEREEKLTQLVLRRGKLSAEEVALLHAIFAAIIHAHHDPLWNQAQRWNPVGQEPSDFVQETFIDLYRYICENGFPDSLPAKLHSIMRGKLSNHVRARTQRQESEPLPSSGSEQPGSGPGVESSLDAHQRRERLLAQLSTEHRQVLELAMTRDLTYKAAGDLLGIPEGTFKSRLIAAKRELVRIALTLPPLSQRAT